ncbi:MAG: hypothetical protein AAB465_02430 [Patescibacteria group bacterium]
MDEPKNDQNIQLPKDILEEIEPLKSSRIATTPNDFAEQQPAKSPDSNINLKKIIFFVGIVVLMLILIAVVYFWVLPSFKGTKLAGSDKKIETQTEPNQEQNQAVNIKPDSDRDGLSDDEESQMETDKNKIDTDGDGLTDYEEAKVYYTDPLKADTDNDGISDGQEVKNNINPLSAVPDAKLFDLQEEIKKLEILNK